MHGPAPRIAAAAALFSQAAGSEWQVRRLAGQIETEEQVAS